MTMRVYKYGLVQIGYQPKEAIDELWRANNLWNTVATQCQERFSAEAEKKRQASACLNGVVFTLSRERPRRVFC